MSQQTHFIWWRNGAGPASCWAADKEEAARIALSGDKHFPADLSTLRPSTQEERDEVYNHMASQHVTSYFRSWE